MDWIPDFERFVLDKMGQTKLSAVSIALVSGDEIIYERGFGLANRELGIAATPRTNYCIGSVTKSFTCLSIMQLQERGLLSVDDPVERFLPLTVRPFGETICIKHLMSHTSGLPALAYLENVLRHHHGAVDRPLPIGGVADMLAFVNGAADWVETKPGERWFYLNEGYILLGGIIEKVSGKKYADYVRENILLPLGMTRSFHQRDLFKADDDVAVPYVLDKDGRHLVREYPWGQAEADGGLISNALDMAKYIRMYLNDGMGQHGSIVHKQSIDAMTQKAVRTPPEDIHTGEAASYYGYGLGTSEFFGRLMVGHSGAMYAATAALRFIRSDRVGAIVLANGTGYALTNIADYALASVLGKDPSDLPALKTEKVLDALTGVYETYKGTFSTTVRNKGDYLTLEYKSKYGSDSVSLVPFDLTFSHPRFWAYGAGRRYAVEFLHRNGNVELINERYKFRRIGRLPA